MTQIGIDVSKKKLDVCWLRDVQKVKVKNRVFANSPAGFDGLIQWLATQTQAAPDALEVMMEATGIYHEALAYALYEQGIRVYVANPHRVSEFAKSFGKRSKTDRKDSVVLARFLASRDDHQHWQPEPTEVRYLKALLARLHALETDIRREHNRLEKAEIQNASARVERSIRTMTASLGQERTSLEQEIDDHIDRHPNLKGDRKLLQSIPGIGRVLSAELMAMLRSRDFRSAGQSAAFIGLVPIMHASGTSVEKHPRLSKAGSGRLRAKIYMGAIVAVRYNHAIRAQYERLTARGKSKMSALGAAMRKLVQMAYGVLKHQTSYQPHGAN